MPLLIELDYLAIGAKFAAINTIGFEFQLTGDIAAAVLLVERELVAVLGVVAIPLDSADSARNTIIHQDEILGVELLGDAGDFASWIDVLDMHAGLVGVHRLDIGEHK